MFDLNGSKSIYNKGEVTQVIYDMGSVTICFQEGYSEDNTFIPVGLDHITLIGEEKDQFILEFSNANNDISVGSTFIQSKRNITTDT